MKPYSEMYLDYFSPSFWMGFSGCRVDPDSEERIIGVAFKLDNFYT